MIPKAEGDSTPLGQRPLCVFTGSLSSLGPRFVLPILKIGFIPGSLALFLVLARVFPRLMPGMPLLLTLKRFLAKLVILTFIS